jgi:uncharacterized protein (TIRG00374 family)
LLAWVLRSVPFSEVWVTLTRLTLGQLLAWLLVNICIQFLFSGRWWIILRAQGYRIPYLSLVGYRLSGFSLSYFTPGPQFGGEPLQVHLLHSRHAVPTATAIAAVSLDRMLELLANFTFVLLGVSVVLHSGLSSGVPLYLILLPVGILLALPVGYLLSLRWGKRPGNWLYKKMLTRWMLSKGVVKIVRSLLVAEEEIALFCKQNFTTLLHAQLVSIFIWLGTLAEYWLTMNFLGLRLDLFQTITLLTAFRLAFLSPIPGGLGVLEAGQVLGAQALGIDPAFGASLSLLTRLRDLAFGGLGLWLGGVLVSRTIPSAKPLEAGD